VTYIREFPYPRFIINYDPDPDSEPYGFDVLDQAMRHRCHAIELHTLYRQSDNLIVWAHDEGFVSASKPLSDAIEYILARMTDETLYGDGLQCFLIIVPHSSEPDNRLFDGLYKLMTQYKDHLSTAVNPHDSARGITFIISNYSSEFHARHHGDEANRLCIVEGVDYTSASSITNLSPENPSFQWVDAYQHPTERGNINQFHIGYPPYNVRVWDADDDQRLALASGADSVNGRPAPNITQFQEVLLNQFPRGTSPGLAVGLHETVLVWRGDSSDNNLYVALSSESFSFSRQINFTWFHQDAPLAKAPAVAIDPKGNLIIVYEGTSAHRLFYVTGKFTRPDSFITFNGREHRLTLPGDAGRRGSNPSVAIAPNGRVLIVYEGIGDQKIWYVSGSVQNGVFKGTEFSLTVGSARRGYTPAVAFDRRGNVVVVYRGTDDSKLWYVSGYVEADTGEIIGQEHLLSQGDARRGFNPAIAFDSTGHVCLVYEGTDDQRLWYVYGTLDATGRIIGNESELTEGDARKGTEPTVAFDENENAVVLYIGTNGEKMWYVRGKFDATGSLIGAEHQLNMALRI
jgi:hypothetical protein